MSQLQSLKSDDPNVNTTIWNKLDKTNLSFTRKKKERFGKYIYMQPSGISQCFSEGSLL